MYRLSIYQHVEDREVNSMRDWKPSPFQAQVTIISGTLELSSMKNSLKLLYLEWMKPDVFKEEVKKLVELKITVL